MPQLTAAVVFLIAVAAASAPVDLSVRPARAQSQAPALQAFTEGTGPPLVMLGGGTFGAVAFAPHARLLAKDFRVIRLQTLNLERVQPQALPPGYSVKLESGAMLRALDALEISGPVDIVGWSFGGLVALDFALDHPERVRTLSLFEPPAFWAVPPDVRAAVPDLQRMIDLTGELLPDRNPTDAQYVRFLCTLGNCGAQPPVVGHADRVNWDLRRSALRGLSVVSAHTDHSARLRALQQPVLIMTGVDTVAFHRRINDLLAAAFPRVERVEITGGHTAPVTAADEFVAKLRAFVARQQP